MCALAGKRWDSKTKAALADFAGSVSGLFAASWPILLVQVSSQSVSGGAEVMGLYVVALPDQIKALDSDS